MPTWRDEIAKMTPAEIVAWSRAVHRQEFGQPGVKWQTFKEQCRRERLEQARLDYKAHQERKEPSETVRKILKRMRYMADRRVKQQGGRTSSNLHELFLHWDCSNSGVLTVGNLIGALSQFGVPIRRSEAKDVVAHYAIKGPSGGMEAREMPYAELLHDASQGAPGLLEIDPSVTTRLLRSSRSEGSLLGTSNPGRKDTAMIRAFREKLQQVIDEQVRDVGGSPGRMLFNKFLNWDTERHGTLSTKELRGALRSLNMHISAIQAQELSRFYAKHGSPDCGCDYMALVKDVCGFDLGPFAHRLEKENKRTIERGDVAAVVTEPPESNRSSEQSRGILHFTARPRNKPQNRSVEKFKLRLRDALENTIKRKGGVNHAIIREAFLNWDGDASGKLDPRELVGALKQMGVRMTDAEAKAAVNYYDLDGSGAMNYELLCKEIEALSHPMLAYVEEVDVLNGLNRAVQEPTLVRSALDRIRVGVIAAGRRAAGSCSSLPPISPQDLLMGTCIRFDTQEMNELGASELKQVWRELRIKLRATETVALVAWLDRSATDRINPSDLCNAVFGGNTCKTQRTSLAASRQKNCPLPPPPKPHVLQARRSAALAMGGSSSAVTATGGCQSFLPAYPPLAELETRKTRGRGRGADRGLREDRPYSENGVAWNWDGRYCQGQGTGGEDKLDGSVTTVSGASARREGMKLARRCGSAGAESRVMRGGVLQANGEAVVAEKARIERRLKELQQEKARVMREKKWVECSEGRTNRRHSSRD